MGILDGLQIALNRGYRKVIIRTDNLEALLSHWNLKHIPREENRFAVKYSKRRETELYVILSYWLKRQTFFYKYKS
ncbi:hypothetical protein Godav_024317 [Gossypium davidsonii]|uniref:RNase H type-1 domain-containing protein n=1 Tax=Gossypium davidsonii TaxID=34287 RepID=A0A7J8SVI3_GOSDV|nr:hypothetical protein [Gossypium davidsonii]